jgi:hypothetical protein
MTLRVVDNAENRSKRNQWWERIWRAKADYELLIQETALSSEQVSAFRYYMKQHYGIEMELIDGMVTSNYFIIDEKKYTIFLLKYGS